MKVITREGSRQRAVLVGMITDKAVLGAVAPRWEPPGLFDSKWENLIGDWCVAHYKRYKKPIGPAVEDVYEQWAASGNKDKATVTLLEGFLKTLSQEYAAAKKGALNTDYVLDLAAEHFNKVKLKGKLEEATDLIQDGKVKEAWELFKTDDKIGIGTGVGMDPMRDDEALRRIFDPNLRETLVKYPGALGNFFGDSIHRGSFLSFMGREKIGKSFWLQDLATRAMQQGRKVAFVEIGDMSQEDFMERWVVRLARRPLKATDEDTGPVKWPIDVSPHGLDVVHSEKDYKKPLDFATAKRLRDAALNGGKDWLFRFSFHPMMSITADDLESMVREWERADWLPDVLVIDYSDNLAPVGGGLIDSRESINYTWKKLRGIAQSWHIAVITATQIKAAGYGKELLDMSDFSENKLKNAHVEGMISLNQTDEEYEKEIWRLGWVFNRRRKYSRMKCCYSAGCLALANPAVKSTF